MTPKKKQTPDPEIPKPTDPIVKPDEESPIPVSPEELPDLIPDEDPFETPPPFEVPKPGEGP
jgi:hypothetical protein